MTKTTRNTLKSILVLFVISSVSVALLALANHFIKVEIKLDLKTAKLINRIAPTGYDDSTALSGKHIKLIDLTKGEYTITDLVKFNKEFGNTSTAIQALYTSKNKDTGKTTKIVEAKGTGYESGAIVMLVAYDDENKISGITTKSQTQSYWNKLGDMDKFYSTFIGKSGKISSSNIAADTGATIMFTLGGISDAVNLANEFSIELGGAVQQPPTLVTDAALNAKLKKVSDNNSFMQHFIKVPNKISSVYVGITASGENGDIIYESLGNFDTYGKVTMLIRTDSDKRVAKVSLISDSFTNTDNNPSEILKSDAKLNEIFVGKSISDIKGMGDNLAGLTGVTQSSTGLKDAVINALEYIDVFAAEVKNVG